MKHFIFIFLLICISTLGYSEHTISIDSLRNQLKPSTGSTRVDILNNLAWELKLENTVEAFEFSNEAYKLATSLKYSKGKAQSARNLAALYTLTNNGEEALKYANEGILYATALRDNYTLAKLYNIKALVLEDKYEYSQALLLFKKAFVLFDNIGDQKETSGILNNMAVLYGLINEKQLELETYIKVIQLEEKAGNKEGLARTYNNLAGVYLDMGRGKIALEFYRTGLQLSREISSVRFESANLNGIGLILRDQKKIDSAIWYISKAAEINKANDYQQWLANNQINLGNIYLLDLNRIDLAKPYIDNALSIYSAIEDWNNCIVCYNLLADWYLKNKDYQNLYKVFREGDRLLDKLASDKFKRDYLYIKYQAAKQQHNTSAALEFLEQVTALNDTLSGRENIQQSYEIQAKYDLARQERENEHLRMNSDLNEATIKRQQIVITAVCVVSILLVIIIFLSIRSKSKIKKVNQELNHISDQIIQKAWELQQANESKDKFLSIISHDLKNPISAVTGLSELLLDQSLEMADEERNKYVKYIHEGCQSADQLLENLMKWVRSQTGKLEMKPQEFDICRTVNDAINLVNNAAIRKEITITSEVSPKTMVYADQEMMNTCVINLLSNAVKFTHLNGTIRISPEINGEMVNLSITDTGVGMSPENLVKLFRLDMKSGTNGTANEKGTGLGLLLVKEFIEKNHGKVNVSSEVGKGSTFTLTIPKNQENFIKESVI